MSETPRRNGRSVGRSLAWTLLGLIPRHDQRELIRQDLEEEWARRIERAESLAGLRLWAAVLESVADWWLETLSWRSVRTRVTAGKGAGVRSGGWLADIRFALRMIRREKVVSGAVAITVLLGVSSTTAVATLLRGVLLRPLPFPESGQIVRISRAAPGQPAPWPVVGLPDMEDWRDRATTMTAIAGWQRGGATLTGMGEAERISLARVTPDLDRVLEIGPALGRLFVPADYDSPEGTSVVLSHTFWVDRHGADVRVIGSTIDLDGRSWTIVGVLPRMEYSYPANVDVWIPLAPGPGSWMRTTRGSSWLTSVGRVESGTPIDVAQADLTRIQAALVEEFPRQQEGQETVRLERLKDVIVAPARTAIRILALTIGLVLLLASVNAGLLLMARSNRRGEEFAVRVVLGSDRRRLKRLVLTEALVMAAIGGVLGIPLALPMVDALIAFYPGGLPRASEIRLEGWVVGVALVTILCAGALASLAPARVLRKADLGSRLRVRGTGGSRSDARTRGLLVGTQMAICTLLLIGAALLSKTFTNLRNSDPGFDPAGLLTFDLAPAAERYVTQGQTSAFYREVLGNLSAIPGVAAAGAVNFLPFTSGEWGGGFDVLGTTYDAAVRVSWPGYFDALGRRIVDGRAFDWRDDETSEPVAILNTAAARLAFGVESPLGRQIEFEGGGRLVVGIVDDIRHHNLVDPPGGEVHVPNTQFTSLASSVVLKSTSEPISLVPAARQILSDIDPNVPLTSIATMDHQIEESVAPERFRAMLLTALGALAAALALIGVYGIVSYAVAQRRREIGIRFALGEPVRSVSARVLRSAAALSLAGVGVGVLMAWSASRWVDSLLYEVSAQDPITFIAVAAALLVFGTASALGPAIRATRVDPLTAIREP